MIRGFYLNNSFKLWVMSVVVAPQKECTLTVFTRLIIQPCKSLTIESLTTSISGFPRPLELFLRPSLPLMFFTFSFSFSCLFSVLLSVSAVAFILLVLSFFTLELFFSHISVLAVACFGLVDLAHLWCKFSRS